jgi:plastocyanin
VRARALLLTVLAVAVASCSSVGAQTVAAFDDAREIEIVATDFAFAPMEITVGAGEQVNIRLTNEGGVQHDVVNRDLGLHVLARRGTSEVAGFVVETPGRYELICSIPGHAREGMVMALIVEE